MSTLLKVEVDSSGGVHYAADFSVGRPFRPLKNVLASGWSLSTQAFNAADEAVVAWLEDLEDLADGLATLRAYESQGAGRFIRYSDYTEQRRRGR